MRLEPPAEQERRCAQARRRHEGGFALVCALFVVAVVAMWSVGSFAHSTVEQRSSLRSAYRARSQHLAEAGLDVAIEAIRTDAEYAGAGFTALGEQLGGYAIQVSQAGLSRRTIVSTGFSPSDDPAGFGYSATSIEATVEMVERAGPGDGILGDRAVRVDGGAGVETQIDSYDSRQGSYTPRARARLRTNASEAGAITLVGAVTVMGDVVLGPGSDPEEALCQTPKSWSSISGSVSVADGAAPTESVELPALPDGGSLTLSGNDELTLPGGLYRFRDIRISGNGHLIFTGPADVYVEGDVEIGGAGVSAAEGRPTNLTLYVKGSRLSFSSHADLFAKLVAPEAAVDLSGPGDLYGAVSAAEVVVQGQSSVHADEALVLFDTALNPPDDGDPVQVDILSWRRSSP